MKCKRGDAVLVMFPESSLVSAKPRPALVVMADGIGTGIDQIVVVMITSNLTRAGHPSRVAIEARSAQGRQMGLLLDSVVMTDNITTICNNLIYRRIGHLDDMSAVDAALRHTLGL